MNPVEDPAVSMARRALFKNNQIYNSVYEEGTGNKLVTRKCFECARSIKSKGSKVKHIDGKKRYICIDCYELKYREED